MNPFEFRIAFVFLLIVLLADVLPASQSDAGLFRLGRVSLLQDLVNKFIEAGLQGNAALEGAQGALAGGEVAMGLMLSGENLQGGRDVTCDWPEPLNYLERTQIFTTLVLFQSFPHCKQRFRPPIAWHG